MHVQWTFHILPQAALLYTNLKGERRLRVHNMALNCSTKYQDIYRSCEMDTLVNYFSKSSELDHPFSDISALFLEVSPQPLGTPVNSS